MIGVGITVFNILCAITMWIVAVRVRRALKSANRVKAVWLRTRPHELTSALLSQRDQHAWGLDRIEVLVQLEDVYGKRTWHVAIDESCAALDQTIDHVAYAHGFGKKPVDTWLDKSDDEVS